MDFGGSISGEMGMGWLKAAMIVCFASAAGVMAYAITIANAAPPMTANTALQTVTPN